MKKLSNQNGFTFLAALMLVVIIGIMLGLTAQPWKTIIKREREQELIFRGLQYRRAIASWYSKPVAPGATVKVIPLTDLNDLLLDPNSLQVARYLRRKYLDPMTGKEWRIIRDEARGGIVGVASTSSEAPLKKSFAEYSGLDSFREAKKYSDWRFVYGGDPGNSQNRLAAAPQ